MNTPNDKSNGGNGEPVKSDPAENKSVKPVSGVAQPKADTDAPKPNPGMAKSPEPVTDETKKDPEFEAALAEKDGAISAEDQKAIDAAMGNHSEQSEEEKAAEARAEAFRADMDSIKKRDGGIHDRLAAFCDGYEHPVTVITKLVRDIPTDTPDDFILYGSQGHVLRMGHLRALVMNIPAK